MATDVLRALAPDAPSDEPSDHTGVMVAFGVSMTVGTQLAVADGMPPEEMHVTLAYLGDVVTDADTVPDLGRLVQVVAQFTQWNGPVSGVIGGGGIFVHSDDPEEDVTAVALVDAPDLPAWRARLVDELRFANIEPRANHGFTPHITLDVGPLAEMQAHPVPPRLALRFDHLAVSYAGRVIQLPLLGGEDDLVRSVGKVPLADLSVAKAAEARYTLTPLYVPELDDSHGEYVVADDLQRAAWDYFRAGDRDVRLQHLPDTVAGEMVELVTWPYAVVADISTGDGTTKRVTLPPGTVYEGVVWQEWAWEMVKTGKINGLSLGGLARIGEDE